jgi:DNA integrity scanning protein DisA with diadenylate cyclase activity
MTEPVVDFAYQLSVSRERIEKRVFQNLRNISEELLMKDEFVGSLIVFGVFKTQVDGMRQFGGSKLEKYINVVGAHEEEFINMVRSGDDGAIVISDSGQILGSGIYLTVDDPTLDIPEGAGTRHISAASFSKRDDILATFTLSEETRIVRKWKDGAVNEQFDPSDDQE